MGTTRPEPVNPTYTTISGSGVYNGWSAGVGFGYSLTSDESAVFVGSPQYAANTGILSYFDPNTANLINHYYADGFGAQKLGGTYYGGIAEDANYFLGGAPSYSGGYSGQGRAYLFDKTSGAGAPSGKWLHIFENPNPNASSRFGDAVAVTGNYSIIGASEDNSTASDSGRVYVFDNTTGNLLHTINNPNPYGTEFQDFFGKGVAASGNYAAVGAIGEDDATGTFVGKVYIIDLTTGSIIHTINDPNDYGASQDDRFGYAISMEGNTLIVSAHGEKTSTGGGYSGRVYVFKTASGNWTDATLEHTIAHPTDLAGAYFGYSVDLSGNYAVIGAPYDGSGKAFIADITTGVVEHTLNESRSTYGLSVTISGDVVAVASPEYDSGRGSVHFYKLS